MKRFFIIILLSLLIISSFAIEPPEVKCLRVKSNNNWVAVSWQSSADCAAFKEYRIYLNNDLRGTINLNDFENMCLCENMDISVIPADAYSCYIIAVDTNNNEYTSNTIQTLPLTGLDVSVDFSTVTINWEDPSTQMGQGWGDFYYLYKKREFEAEFPEEPFAIVPVTEHSYTDTSDVCHRYVSYQVGITNFYGENEHCLFMSGIDSAELVDIYQPACPVLDSVSTTENNEVMLGFHSEEDYMMGYIIYSSDGVNGWIPRDTVYDGATTWIDPQGGANCYRIAVLDSCSNSSEIIKDEQCNIILQPGEPDICKRTVPLSWNGYANMPGGVDYYEIFIQENGNLDWQSVGTTTGTSFVLENLDGSDYLAFVRAYGIIDDDTITASSDRVDFHIESYIRSDFSYIRSVSVEDNSYLKIKVYTSGDTLPFHSITLQKSTDGQTFTNLQTITYNPASPTYTFIDSTVNVQRNIYYYQTFITDHCDMLAGESDVMHNILLAGESTSAQEDVLQWGNYATDYSMGDQYSIFRKSEIDPDFVLLGTVPPNAMNTYTDDVSELYETGSKFKYYVQVQQETDEYGFNDVMNSNQVSLMQIPNTYIPNAFAPYSTTNYEFKPVNSFVPTDNYLFMIFSRTGQLIFKTEDPFKGWDGTINGNPVPMDVYMYKITYIRPDGTPFEKVGSVTLLH